MLTRCACAAAIALLAACGDDDGTATPTPDAGISVDASFTVAPPAPPEIPWLDLDTFEESLAVAPPAITPCPDGWREVTGECDPWPEGGPLACGLGAAHFPGEPGCRSVGLACPPGDFAIGLPDDGTVIFVRAGAGGTPDGTRASPFATIADAMAVATAGQTVALAKGSYDELVVLPAGVALAGACAGETVIAATRGTGYAQVYTESADTALSDVSITGDWAPGVIASGEGASLAVSGVVVTGVYAVGIVAAAGATITIEDVAVSAVEPAMDGLQGTAILAQGGSHVTVSRAVLHDNRVGGLVAIEPGTRLEVSDAVVRDTRGTMAGVYGDGLYVDLGAEATLLRSEIARANRVGIAALEGTVSIDQCVIRDTVGYVTDSYVVGAALAAVGSTTARVSRSVLRGNDTYTVFASLAAEVTLEDVIVRDTEPYADGEWGFGVWIDDGVSLTATRAVVERSHVAALRAFGAGTSATLTDAVLRDTMPTAADDTFGRGIEVLEGAAVGLQRARIENNRAHGIFVLNGTLELEDAIVRETTPQAGSNDGFGVLIAPGSTATASRVLLAENGAAGLAGIGSELSLSDLVVHGTVSTALADEVSGVGLDLRDGATVTGRRLLAADNQVIGIGASGSGTSLALEDVEARDTQPRGEGTGYGLVAYTGTAVELTRVDSHRNIVGLGARGPSTTVTVTDGYFHDTLSAPGTLRGGQGVLALEGVRLTMTRAAIERTFRTGLTVQGGSGATLDRFRVRDVMAEACGDSCSGGFGIGLVSQVGSAVTASTFELRGAALCGAFVAAAAELDLSNGEIAENDIGACLEIAGYDVQRVTRGVRYRDNRVNVETVDFAVPEPEVSLDGL